MKHSTQARLSSAQIQAIRRKRQEGWTPRQIETDTGVDHVTVWRHTRNINPGTTRKEAEYNEAGSRIALSAPVAPLATTLSNGPLQTNPATYHYMPPAPPSQPVIALTYPQLISPEQRPGLEEHVMIRTVERKRKKDRYDELQDDYDRYLVHKAKMAFLQARIEQYNRVTREIEKITIFESKTKAQRQGPDNEGSIQAADILTFLTALAAERMRNGIDPGEAARRFGEDIDTCLLLALANRRSTGN